MGFKRSIQGLLARECIVETKRTVFLTELDILGIDSFKRISI